MDIENTANSHQHARERLDFPELKCSLHKSQVILVCIRPDCKHRIFLCAKCVSTELNHVNEHDPLMVYDDFIEFLARSVGPNTQASTESQELLGRKANNVSDFEDNLNFQRANISDTIKSLANLYEEKCSELSNSLENVLNSQSKVFSLNYEKFEHEVRTDKEEDAEIPKFSQIRERVRSITDLGEIEEYLHHILRKKQNWLQASEQIRSLSNRTEDFYRNSIVQQLSHLPKFSNSGSVVAQWTQGLTRLIEQISSDAVIFENLYPENQGIQTEVRTVQELRLLTNNMLKAETHLKILFENTTISNEQASDIANSLSNLTSLHWVHLSFERTKVDQASVALVLNALRHLQNLSHLYLNFQGEEFQSSNELAAAVREAKRLRHLSINLSETNITNSAVGELSSTLSELQHLETLAIDLSATQISHIGAENLSVNLSSLKQIRGLHLDLGGYSFRKNNIGDAGLAALAKSIGALPALVELQLRVSQNSISDSALNDLALGLRENVKLANLTLDISHNSVQRSGIKKLAKNLALLGLRELNLNLNNNQLKEGAGDLTYWLARIQSLVQLQLNLRNIGLKKEEARKVKADLLAGKIGRAFERAEIHL